MRPRKFRHSLWLLTVISLVGISCVATNGCSKKAPKYPEDHARFQRVVQAIRTLETTYVSQDISGFHELLLPLEPLEKLETWTREDFAIFSNIQLDLTVDRIIIDGNHISAFISWEGRWQRSSSEQNLSDIARGHGVLLWSGKNVILLRGVEGDVPFGINSRFNISL